MSTGIKNGKQCTINIYSVKLISVLLMLFSFSLQASDNKKGEGWVIVIDAGHGGRDPGAVGSFSYEKNITLAIALKTGDYIEKNLKNVKVVYTRKRDSTLNLYDRPKIANQANADLFISIHANMSTSKGIKGTETFIMGLTQDDQNLQVAMKENEVIYLEKDYSTKYEGFDPKSPESYVMFTLMQNIYQEQSTGLASKIQTQYKENNKRYDRGVKQAGFWVLYNTTMPSVLTETGFISNPEEEKYLNSPEGQDNIASALFRACLEYINEIDSKSGISTAVSQDKEPRNIAEYIESGGNDEITFMIQVATSLVKSGKTPDNFKGLTDILEIQSADRIRYLTGKFTDYDLAVKYRKKLEDVYPDAFVVAVKSNKILPLQQALEQKKKNKTNK
jgi:N-acetylmuramoyl-L-alanine amidase